MRDDIPEEELGELIAELRPAPDEWVRRALAIGGAAPPGADAQPPSRTDAAVVRSPDADDASTG